ncbi:MAG: hypothetical protein KDD52_09930, partial [Bdellovibrionales bacterium]|nr:hypothetical protein [Bdellovibrionales bacterium]
QTGSSSVDLIFASDPENLSNLDVYVNQFQQIGEGNVVKFARNAQNEFCIRIRKGFDFRMAGICLLKAVVKLPANSNIQIIDENGIRINDSSLPISKSEFFNALEHASVGGELRVVRQYVKNHRPQDKLNENEVMTILSNVSISEEIDALKAIYPMIVPKPISVDFAIALLDKVSISDQTQAFLLLLQDLPVPITPRDLGRLLDEVSLSDKLKAFKHLAPLVDRNQRAELFEIIDNELGISDGKEARRFFFFF